MSLKLTIVQYSSKPHDKCTMFIILIGVCTDTNVIYQSVLEKKDLLVICIAKDIMS